jgi:hypothetical protein
VPDDFAETYEAYMGIIHPEDRERSESFRISQLSNGLRKNSNIRKMNSMRETRSSLVSSICPK